MAGSISSIAMKSAVYLRMQLGSVPPSVSAVLSSRTQTLLKPSFFKTHLSLMILGTQKPFAATFASLSNNNNEGVSGSDSELHSRPGLKWVISSGVSGHVTSTESVLENKRLLPSPISVKWGYGSSVSGSVMGDVTISPGITLKDVVLFDDDRCKVIDAVTGDTVAVGRPDGKGRFLLHMEDTEDGMKRKSKVTSKAKYVTVVYQNASMAGNRMSRGQNDFDSPQLSFWEPLSHPFPTSQMFQQALKDHRLAFPMHLDPGKMHPPDLLQKCHQVIPQAVHEDASELPSAILKLRSARVDFFSDDPAHSTYSVERPGSESTTQRKPKIQTLMH
ncbi:hypothetical protein Cgig2_020823 [Carnegiea gigantea]|uniref:Uncharacterized protein n=1 Tax=Carnegiea gigantea TaxID=171969 RepID=A0A9Q1KIN8_9CARY|nr:hypothetical protein Cgig2_020823 [Carnegiea gigantea]